MLAAAVAAGALLPPGEACPDTRPPFPRRLIRVPNEVAQEWYKKRRVCEQYRQAKKVAAAPV